MQHNPVAPDLGTFEHAGHADAAVFGFWLYLMTDCILFGSLFAVFAVMRTSFAGGPTAKDLLDIPGVAIETFLLLLSSITYGFAMLSANRQDTSRMTGWLTITFFLGAGFLGLEIHEFSSLVAEGNGPGRSAFLSAFFTLVGTHGLHVTVGLIWMAVLMVQTIGRRSVSAGAMTRLTCLSLFWHFLDIVWICVFSFVYLMSVV
jgi:cytochrome o ubiquinol oxidase subunit 3